MTPSQLAKSGTEAGHQMALMCWAQVAEQYGFDVAWQYDAEALKISSIVEAIGSKPVPQLAWLYAIANGGARGDDERTRYIRGGQLKAQGVKAGVSDLCLPVRGLSRSAAIETYSGLYIEMKKPGNINKTTPEQKAFGLFVQQQGFAFFVSDNWKDAAIGIQSFIEGRFGDF